MRWGRPTLSIAFTSARFRSCSGICGRRAARSACTRTLMDAARKTGGVVVVDYHARGMNGDFYPRYGPWLLDFLKTQADASMEFRQPRAVVHAYEQYEQELTDASRDLTEAVSTV